MKLVARKQPYETTLVKKYVQFLGKILNILASNLKLSHILNVQLFQTADSPHYLRHSKMELIEDLREIASNKSALLPELRKLINLYEILPNKNPQANVCTLIQLS